MKTDFDTTRYGFLILIVLSAGLFACSKPPAEAALRSDIERIAQAVQAKRSQDILPFIDDQMTTAQGLGKQDLQRMLFVYFRRYKNVSVTISRLDVDMSADERRARVLAIVLLSGAKNLVPQSGNIYRIESDWYLNDGHWLIDDVSWQGAH